MTRGSRCLEVMIGDRHDVSATPIEKHFLEGDNAQCGLETASAALEGNSPASKPASANTQCYFI